VNGIDFAAHSFARHESIQPELRHTGWDKALEPPAEGNSISRRPGQYSRIQKAN